MALTIGLSSPNALTQNLDTVLTLAFANSGDSIFDAISKNNALFHDIKTNGMYEGVAAPEPMIEVPLMYGLGKAEWYEGWDVLSTLPTEGVTAALYEWRQLAVPAGYNRREQRLTNPARIREIVKVKIEQAKLGMIEAFNTAFLQGNLAAGGAITTPIVSPTTGRSGIEPLPKLIHYTTGLTFAKNTSALTVGGLAQATYAWWQNWCHTSSATTMTGFLFEFDRMYERCSRGPGGPPNLIITDETTRALLNASYYLKYRTYMKEDATYPFDNLMFRKARVVVDELVPDVESGTGNTDTYGSAFFVNNQFIKVKYDTQANFVLGEMQKPTNQDGRVGHCIWMGNSVANNRRKLGVIGKFARTLTAS